MSVKDKLRGVTLPAFEFSKTWTFDEITAWWRKIKLLRQIRKILKECKNVGKF